MIHAIVNCSFVIINQQNVLFIKIFDTISSFCQYLVLHSQSSSVQPVPASHSNKYILRLFMFFSSKYFSLAVVVMRFLSKTEVNKNNNKKNNV